MLKAFSLLSATMYRYSQVTGKPNECLDTKSNYTIQTDEN